jgi:hypothetical protein
MRFLLISLWILFIFLTGPILAQENAKQTTARVMPAPIASIVATPSELSSKTEEITVLREQNKLIREYQSSLLNTVYWALTGILALAAVLAGFNWWTNNKIYEVERDRFREQVDAQISKFGASVSLQLEANKTDFLQLVDSRIDILTSRYLSEFSNIRDHVETVRAEINKSISAIEEKCTVIEGSVKENEKDILENTWNLRTAEEYIWDIKGIPGNVLLTLSQGLAAALMAKSAFKINFSLERIKKVISEKIITENKSISRKSYDELIKRLNDAANYQPVLSNELIMLMQKVQVTESG